MVKLSLSPNEFMALFELLTAADVQDDCDCPSATGNVLDKLRSRMRNAIVTTFANNDLTISSTDELMDRWEQDQAKKIADLVTQNQQDRGTPVKNKKK
jgi:hypothetical protein